VAQLILQGPVVSLPQCVFVAQVPLCAGVWLN